MADKDILELKKYHWCRFRRRKGKENAAPIPTSFKKEEGHE
ncbi:hypothetical protein TNCV_1217571, partial [Trichonephila clavipes]